MQLATVYSAPGAVWLARNGQSDRVGCIGLRALPSSPGQGEIRRLFVRPGQRGARVGQQLVDALIDHARGQSMNRLVLNTLPQMATAVKLYEELGFTVIDCYQDEPTEGVLYFGLDL